AYSKAQGKTLWDSVQELFSTYGYFKEETVSITKKGIDGMKEIKEDMQYFRDNPIESAGGLKVLKIRDYLKSEETGLDPSNVLYYELENDSFAAVRPSGTEPKIKYYVGIKGKDEAEAAKVLEAVKADLVR
ncbi:MAG: phospho-sugar mutase, partial [Parasporobacterium sp.]|nr:phospho-sugar mutase [Parasporobacterium sp.]